VSHTCVVTNQTGNLITSVSIQKFFGDSPDGSVSVDTMNLNDQISFNFTGGSGSGDYWTLQFNLNGVTYYRNRKRCDVETEDLSAPQPVNLNLLPPAQGFSVEMPVSSSCDDNYYDS